MGLDLTGYSGITKLSEEDAAKVCDEDGDLLDDGSYFRPMLNDAFPLQGEGLEDNATYAFTEAEECNAGSYGSYGLWRDRLAELAGYEPVVGHSRPHAAACWARPEGPFSDLINFSDCEGTIGTAACMRIAADFDKFEDAARCVGRTDPRFYERYQEIHQIFKLGADRGAVDFH